MAEFAKGICLDLSNALTPQPEAFAHLPEGPQLAVGQAKAKLENTPFAWGEEIQDVLNLRAEHGARYDLRG